MLGQKVLYILLMSRSNRSRRRNRSMQNAMRARRRQQNLRKLKWKETMEDNTQIEQHPNQEQQLELFPEDSPSADGKLNHQKILFEAQTLELGEDIPPPWELLEEVESPQQSHQLELSFPEDQESDQRHILYPENGM